MIKKFGNTKPDVCRKVVRKVERKQEPDTMSDTRKVDLAIMAKKLHYFAVQCSKYLQSRQQMNNTMCR